VGVSSQMSLVVGWKAASKAARSLRSMNVKSMLHTGFTMRRKYPGRSEVDEVRASPGTG
jgi:hypothetical protein